MEVKASEFEAKCLELLDRVQAEGETFVITKNGRRVAKIGPIVERPASLFGLHAGRVAFDESDDLIESPLS